MRNYFLCFCACLFLFRCSPTINGQVVDQITETGFQNAAGERIEIPNFNDPNTTVFYLVRHAEKVLEGNNPDLTADGKARAEKLAALLTEAPLAGVYSTNFKRTLQTAQPTAKDHQLSVKSYDHQSLDKVLDTINPKAGQHYLIVGHSNSTPNLLNLFAGKKKYDSIDESIYDNLYIVLVNKEDRVKILTLKYGS